MRNITLLSFLLIVFICFGCKCHYKDYKDEIIGIWTRNVDLSVEPMPYGYKSDIRYIFYYDSANFYPGSYEKVADYGEFITVKLITNRMDYKIKKDKLILKYLVKKDSTYVYETEVLRILKLNTDTLRLLRNDSIILNFFRLYDVYQ
jgi:hypothetical protein